MRPMDGFGTKLRRLRESLDVTQSQMARRAVEGAVGGPTAQSISNHISRVERGEETNPSMEFIERAARGLGLSLAEFFTRLDNQSPTPPPQPSSGDWDGAPKDGDFIARFVGAIDRLIAARGIPRNESDAGQALSRVIELPPEFPLEKKPAVVAFVKSLSQGAVEVPEVPEPLQSVRASRSRASAARSKKAR